MEPCETLTGQLTIEGETHLLLDGVDAAICLRLVVQKQVVIPARSQMDVSKKTVYSNLKATRDTGRASWMTESGEAAHERQVARTLVPNRLLEVPVRVMNVSDQPVTWEKGAAVSILEQVFVMVPMIPDTKTAPNSTFKTDLLAAVDSDLHPADVETFSHLIDEFEDMFSKCDYDLGSTDIVTHSIDMGDHTPIRQPLRRHPSRIYRH